MSGAVLILPNGARLQGDPADPAFRAMVAELVGSPAPKHAPKRAGDQRPRRAAV